MLFSEFIVKQRRIHFIGIGGIGMSGIAEILLNLGYKISGSDLRRSPITERLAKMGAATFEGHAAEHVRGADVVVYSSAIPNSNPEYAAAVRDGIPTIQRGELLAELMRLKYGIAIAGSHGKTTTTSITAAVLHEAEKDPTVVVGGRVGSLGSNARLGKSDLLLVEADESDGSFLHLMPIIAVITNVDREHMDHYASMQEVEQAFLDFANKVPFYGAAILCLDDPTLRRLAPQVRSKVLTYGTEEKSPDADLAISNVECRHLVSRFDLTYRGKKMGRFEVNGVGRHTVLNAAAAALVALELEASPEDVRRGLRGFIGVDRRFQLKGERGGVTVIDDYGHHPTEIAATLAAARTCDFKRLLVVFQPHRYSRTKLLADEFSRSFKDCDRLWVTDIYAASEEPLAGVNSVGLSQRIREQGGTDAVYAESISAAIGAAVEASEAGDAILTLGAGSIGRAGDDVMRALEAKVSGKDAVNEAAASSGGSA